MAIGVTLEFPSITTAQYDEVCRLMGLTPRGAGPAGLLFHWAAVSGDGMLITDVWREKERFEEFARDQIGPLSQQAGVTTPPKTTFEGVYNYLTAGALTATPTPIAVLQDYEGQISQYDEALDLMGYTREGRGADGGLFHWVTEIEGGARITDVWQDRATFERFAEEQLAPVAAKIGIQPAKSLVVLDVYNYFTTGA